MRTRLAALIVATSLVASLGGLTHATPGRVPPFAIKDAKIVVAPGKVLERATIVFRDGRIEAVGPAVTPPADAVVEDGRGLTVYPGWIDAGCPFPLEATTPEAQRAREGEQPNLQEDPPIETPEARRKGVHPALDLAAATLLDGDRRTQERKAGFTAALAIPPRGYLSGRSALFALGERSRRSSVIEPSVFLHVSFDGPENVPWGTYPSTLMGAFAHIRQAFADARRERELEERAKRHANGPRPAYDPDLDALATVLDGKQRVAWSADSDEDVARTLALAHELGLDPVLTELRHAGKSAALLRREHRKAIVSLAWSPKPKPATLEPDSEPAPRKGQHGKPLQGPYFLASIDPAPIGTATKPGAKPRAEKEKIDPTQEPRAVFEERERKRADEVRVLGELFAAGVPVGVESNGLHAPGEVRAQLREAIKAGLPEEVALAALTRDAALVLGVSDRLGTLEKGKLAFATVLTGSLGDEKAKVRFTVVDGERLEAEKLDDDRKLARLAGHYRFEAGTVRGALVLEVFAGKLSARVKVEGREASIGTVSFENDRVKLAIPKEALAAKNDVPVDARWIAPDSLEGTASFPDGPRIFRADREPTPHQEGDDGR